MPINPAEWLETAEKLVTAPELTEADLRRAVSTAYYAVFHLVLATATQQLRGPVTDSAYTTLYRRFAHRHLFDVCEGLDVAVLLPKWAARLGFSIPSPSTRDFARWFMELQQAREEADYNPDRTQDPKMSSMAVQLAGETMAAFRAIPAQELRTILLWMQFGSR